MAFQRLLTFLTIVHASQFGTLPGVVVSADFDSEHSSFDVGCAQSDGQVDSEQCVHPIHVAVELDPTCDRNCADGIAADHGMKLLNKIGDLPGWYMFGYASQQPQPQSSLQRRHKRHAALRLSVDTRVRHHMEQLPQRRVKRDLTADMGYSLARVKRKSKHSPPNLPWPDPLFRKQWYLDGGAAGGYDMNVRDAWNQGYSGRGAVVSILDDGIQLDHLDIAQNYDSQASSDINDHDADPTPQDNGDNMHGTRCAGEVAAVAGNQQCGVGVAYNASVGGVRMLDGPVSDSVEAAALGLNQGHIDIYSASWGPEDDGRTFDGPGPLARRAFERGVTEGRRGRGNIFVWASGNGGSHLDSCSADGYTTSTYTLSISSATWDNTKPWYLEECPSTIASTYSSANLGQPAIVTVDVPRGCTERHTGTSASAPLAAGIIALALEANKDLSWRDVQHVVLRTANPGPLLNNAGWSQNGVGRQVSSKFGYGLMDAGALVRLSEKWKTVPEQNKCEIDFDMSTEGSNRRVELNGKFRHEFRIDADDCNGMVRYLEHVHAKVTLKFSKRGAVQLSLLSPAGTRSVLLPPRPYDSAHSGFHQWPFLTVHNWGEDPRGTWTLVVENTGAPQQHGTFHGWSLVLYGTSEPAQSTDPTYAPTANSRPNSLRGGAAVPSGDQLVSQGGGGIQPQPQSPSTATHPPNVGDCHAECTDEGCWRSRSASACFHCKHFATALPAKQTHEHGQNVTFKCLQSCPDGYYVESATSAGGVCRRCGRSCASCAQAEVCTRCSDKQHKLIEVDGRADRAHGEKPVLYHRGQCVDECPKGWVQKDVAAEFGEPITSCFPPDRPCGHKHYFSQRFSKCMPCSAACASECSGGGEYDCEGGCAQGYRKQRNRCRPCCSPEQLNGWRHVLDDCADCRPDASTIHLTSPWVIILLLAALCGGLFCVTFACCSAMDEKKENYSYSSLPVRYNEGKSGRPTSNGVDFENGVVALVSSDNDNSDMCSDADDDAVFDRAKMLVQR